MNRYYYPKNVPDYNSYPELLCKRKLKCFIKPEKCNKLSCRYWVKSNELKNCVLNCDRAMTLQEIGDAIGLTRERIRQIEEMVIIRIKKRQDRI